MYLNFLVVTEFFLGRSRGGGGRVYVKINIGTMFGTNAMPVTLSEPIVPLKET
jgi:hypothetical protein